MGDFRKAEIKRLRSDARKLTTIAKHLREDAKRISAEIRAEEKSKNFFAKKSTITGDTIEPDVVNIVSFIDSEEYN